jgi:nucleoside-diphosphate-sugar epimerase
MAVQALVTGGAGFIGSHLAATLVERGWGVRVLDSFATGHRENLAGVERDVEVFEGDLRDADACERACRGAEVIFHMGALGSVPRSLDDPLTTHAANVTGTLNLLVGARKHGARRLVFSSSSSVYGDTPVLPKVETMPPGPRSPYAASKLAGEEYCRAFSRTMGLDTVVLRYFNVFGPRQDPESQYAAVIPRFIAALLRGDPPVIYGDGLQSRDFTYVSNVVDANLKAADAPGVAGEVFNIACGEQITVLDVLKRIAEQLGKPCRPDFQPPRPGDVKHSCAAIEAARRALGYEPRVFFNEGLQRTLGAYR